MAPKREIKYINRWQFAAFLLVVLAYGCSDSGNVSLTNPQFVSPAVAYNPRDFLPGNKFSGLSRGQIVKDLHLLKKNGFRSLVTYSSSGVFGSIPEIAREEGFDGTIIMGIWDPFSEEEWDNALSQAPFVDGYCLGNEGLGIRYSPDELTSKMTALRQLTSHPVTTSEPIRSYIEGPYRDWLLAHSDWLFPIAHPFWAAYSDPYQAVNWVVVHHDYLAATAGRKVILKEAGVPSAGSEGYTEGTQIAFFEALEPTGLAFFYFEAFDQPWKRDVLGHHEVEAHWGLYRADGTPKAVIPWLANRWAR